MNKRICYICKKAVDVRPYGENGQYICFACMRACPKREETAKRILGDLLNQSDTTLLTDDGPVPFHGIMPKEGES